MDNPQKNKNLDTNITNENDIERVFKKLDLGTPEKRSYYQPISNHQSQLNFTIGYSSTTGGPLKNA